MLAGVLVVAALLWWADHVGDPCRLGARGVPIELRLDSCPRIDPYGPPVQREVGEPGGVKLPAWFGGQVVR